MLRQAILLCFLGFSLIYFTSYSSGPTAQARDVTGSPLSTQQCAGCHTGGNFNPSTEITLLDQGESVTAYEPGKTYTLQVSVAADNNPAGYGFQTVVLDAANNNAGTFGAPAEDFRVATSSMRDYVEHVRRQSSSMLEIEWTAPMPGTGEISVYAAGNAVNFNSSTLGDNVDTDVLTLQEVGITSTVDLGKQLDFTAYQSAADYLQLELGELLTLPIRYSVHDLSGRVIQAGATNTAELTVAINNAPQWLLIVVRDADGNGGTQQLVWR